jgi:phosphatidate cytidylyltransferase
MADEDRTGPKDDADSEVLSFQMTDRDDSEELEDDEPHLTPANPDTGFDGWLDGEENPYDDLADEGSAADEVADWIAFARGEGESDDADEGDPPSEADESAPDYGAGSWIGDGDPPVEYTIKGNADSMLYHRSDSWMYDQTDAEVWFVSEAAAIAAGFAPSPTHPSAGDPALEEEPASTSTDAPPAGEPADHDDTSEFDIPGLASDTGEIPVVQGDEAPEDTGELPVVAMDDLDAVAEFPAITLEDEGEDQAGEDEPIDRLTEEEYLGASTQDHAELAAAIAAAEIEATEKVALSASIPGLESGVVGFEDVVEESGVEEEPMQQPDSSNLVLRVGTALALVAALALSLLWRPALIVFVLAVLVIAAGEFYSALIHSHFKPLSLFGFLGIAGACLGTAAWGVGAIPISLALMGTILLLFSAVSPRRDQPAANFSLTILVAAWIGGLGAFAFDIIAAEDYRVLVISLVAMVALVDIASFFVGGRIGRRPMSPVISPKKTVEGLVAGTLTALAVGAAVGYLVDPIDLPTGLALGAVVAVFAPIGDLAVSVVKRSLEIKDMGSILPGHGGLLDRIDGVIAVIPAAWVVLTWLAVI